MDALLLPDDVANALGAAGYRAVAAAGPDRTGVLARPVDGTDAPVEVHVVATTVDDVLRARLLRLRAVRHEHLVQLLDAWEVSPGRLALVVEHVPGMSLAEIRSTRAPLSDGEAATVTIPVAQALDALHDAGLVHAGVAPTSVLVRPDGRPVLVDLRAAVLGTGEADADLRRLVATVLAQMTGADADLVSREDDRPTLRDAFEALLRAPDVCAGRVVDGCFEAVEPEPVRLPDAGARAAADLLRGAARGAATPVGPRPRPGRRGHRPGLVAVAAVGGLLAIGGLGVAVRTWLDAPPSVSASERDRDPATTTQAGAVDALRDRSDPVAAAVALTRRRVAVVASGDGSRLVEAERPGGPAHTVDSALLDTLRGLRAEGLTVDVTDARAVTLPETDEEVAARVAVTAVMSAYTRVSEDGGTRVAVGATPPRTVVLGLSWTADGWRVWDVDEAPAG